MKWTQKSSVSCVSSPSLFVWITTSTTSCSAVCVFSHVTLSQHHTGRALVPHHLRSPTGCSLAQHNDLSVTRQTELHWDGRCLMRPVQSKDKEPNDKSSTINKVRSEVMRYATGDRKSQNRGIGRNQSNTERFGVCFHYAGVCSVCLWVTGKRKIVFLHLFHLFKPTRLKAQVYLAGLHTTGWRITACDLWPLRSRLDKQSHTHGLGVAC